MRLTWRRETHLEDHRLKVRAVELPRDGEDCGGLTRSRRTVEQEVGDALLLNEPRYCGRVRRCEAGSAHWSSGCPRGRPSRSASVADTSPPTATPICPALAQASRIAVAQRTSCRRDGARSILAGASTSSISSSSGASARLFFLADAMVRGRRGCVAGAESTASGER